MVHEDFRPKATLMVTISILALLFVIDMAASAWSSLRFSSALLDNSYVAVLQFDKDGSDQEQNNLSDSMSEDILSALSKRNGVFVKKIQLKNQEKGRSRYRGYLSYKRLLGRVKQIAEKHGVRYFVTGKIHKYGDNLRVTTRLIDAVTGDLLWINQYKDSIREITSLKNAIADKIVDDIAVELVALNQSCTGTNC